jgi:hypothetical protein
VIATYIVILFQFKWIIYRGICFCTCN